MGCHSSKPRRPAQAEPLPLDEEVCRLMRHLLRSTPLPTLLSIKDSIIKNQSLLCMVRDFLKSEISTNNMDATSLTSEFILTRKKLLDKIARKIIEIKRKLRKSKKLKKITEIVVKVAIVTVSVVAIVLVAMSMPTAITTSIITGNNLITAGGTLLDSAWASHLEGLKGEEDVLLAMLNRLLEVRITQELKSLCETVNHLNDVINTRRLAIDSNVEEVAILNEIKTNIVKDIEEIISQMEVRVEASNGEIRKTVSDFLKKTVDVKISEGKHAERGFDVFL